MDKNIRLQKNIDFCMQNSFARWIHLLRTHAGYYEHKIPIEKRVHPTLDDICNEMQAYVDAILLFRGE